MGNSIQFGLGTSSIAQLLHAVGDVCDAEGLSASDVHSVLFLNDETEADIVRPDGSRRHNIYPFAAIACRSKAPVREAMTH